MSYEDVKILGLGRAGKHLWGMDEAGRDWIEQNREKLIEEGFIPLTEPDWPTSGVTCFEYEVNLDA